MAIECQVGTGNKKRRRMDVALGDTTFSQRKDSIAFLKLMMSNDNISIENFIISYGFKLTR
jgi:hypothetical protein